MTGQIFTKIIHLHVIQLKVTITKRGYDKNIESQFCIDTLRSRPIDHFKTKNRSLN